MFHDFIVMQSLNLRLSNQVKELLRIFLESLFLHSYPLIFQSVFNLRKEGHEAR